VAALLALNTVDGLAPWTEKWSMQRKPSWKILENVCEDNNRCIAGNCTPADVQQSASR
jgi:hypothetical protein